MRYELTDYEWIAIRPILPNKPRGVPRALFAKLTASARGERTVFYNSARPPAASGCVLKRFETSTRTNWHYGCAAAFASRRL